MKASTRIRKTNVHIRESTLLIDHIHDVSIITSSKGMLLKQRPYPVRVTNPDINVNGVTFFIKKFTHGLLKSVMLCATYDSFKGYYDDSVTNIDYFRRILPGEGIRTVSNP